MVNFTLRAATEKESAAIRRLIYKVGINPMSLDWRRFVVAVDSADRMIGCGQLKPHGRDVVELASLAVEPDWRGKGVARAIIEYLLERAPRPLYLMCRAELGRFYNKWGFRALEIAAMPAYFQRMARLTRLFAPIAGEGGGLLVMELK